MRSAARGSTPVKSRERENTFNQHGEGKSRERERMHSINMEMEKVEREREYIQSIWRGKK